MAIYIAADGTIKSTFGWPASVAAPTFSQLTATSDVVTKDLSITPQGPFAGAVTNLIPGNLKLNFASPISGNPNSGLEIYSGASLEGSWAIGNYSGLGVNAFLFGQVARASRGTTNWAFGASSSQTFFNATTELAFGTAGNLGTSIDITVNGIQLFQRTAALGGGVGVLGITNATTNPTTNPSGGGVLYSTNAGGALTYRGPSGTTTTIAPA
jgi:hypothetical protein